MNWVYLVGSITGVAILVGLNAMLFGVPGARLAGLPDAVRRLKDEVAGFRVGDAALDMNATAALVENSGNGIVYLVVARGDGLVTRALKKGSLRLSVRVGATLSLRLPDFTLPRARLTLSDEASAQAWEARLLRAGG